MIEFKSFISAESLDTTRIMCSNDLLISLPDWKFHAKIAFHSLHQHDGRLDIRIKRHDLQNCVEKFWNTVTVCTQKYTSALLRSGTTREVAITDTDPVTMPHFA